MRRLWLLKCLCLLATAGLARAQQVDVTQLRDVSAMDAAWRIRVGGDEAFVQPGYDDSTWPLLRPGGALADAGIGELKGPVYCTARVHVRGAQQATGIDLASLGGLPYAVWADGVEIAESSGWKSRLGSNETPFAIALPRRQDVLVTVRWFVVGHTTLGHFPLVHMEAGPLRAVAASAELGRVQNFRAWGWTMLASSCL